MPFNVNAPATLGLEWAPPVEGAVALLTPSTCAAFIVPSSVIETITKIHVATEWDGPSSGYGRLAIDIYDLADTGAGQAPLTTRYTPNEDLAVTQLFKTTAGTGGSWSSVALGGAFGTINDSDDTDDWLNITFTTALRNAFNTGAMSSSLQVNSVSVEIRAYGHWGTNPIAYIDLYNGSTFVSRLGELRPPGTGDGTNPTWSTYTLGPFTVNPLTGAPWTATDIINMDTGTNLNLRIYGQVGNLSIAYLNLLVQTGTDKRVARGTSAVQTVKPTGRQTNLPATLVANWSKQTAKDYLFIVRRLDDPAGQSAALIPKVCYFDGDATPHGKGVERSSTLNSDGSLAAAGTAGTKTFAVWLERSDGAMSADSNPYHDLALRACHTSSSLRSGFSGASAQAYKGIRAIVAVSGTPSSALTLKVRRVSDNVQVGGDATITTANLATATLLGTIADATYGTVSLYSVLTNLATSATLASATSYYLEATSSTPSTAPWLLLMLDATATHTLTGNQTYGGSSDQATVAGVGVAQGDFAVRLFSSIAAPSGITATAGTTTFNGATIGRVLVGWTSGGALGSAFARWEVERSLDGGTTWTLVKSERVEATVSWYDHEGPRGVAAKYRVRAVRTDGAVSDWTTLSGTATPAATPGAAIVFTSNAAPNLTVAYPILGTDTDIEFLSASETVYVRLFDADYQAEFRPREERGIRWKFDAVVHMDRATTPSSGEGIRAFDALRTLARSADRPYIALHTPDGETLYGGITVGAGRRRAFSRYYTAQVVFTQTQADSSVV